MLSIRNLTTSIKIMFNILYFGVIPTYLALQKDWGWWLGYAISVVVYYFLIQSFHSASAALNIIMAKVTYDILPEDDQLEVDAVADNILTVLKSDPGADFENEFEQFGYSALAMRDLGIDPVIFFKTWFPVKNPSKLPSDKWISMFIKKASKIMNSPESSPAADSS